MEKIPAACAMEWSIQLHKNLRSKEPGKTIEALKEIGSHLERWNEKSRPTVVAEYRLFGLIPGEEKLFLNSIFLRLTDAFRLGNKQTKNEVVKLFLRIRRRRRKRDGGEEGILSKDRLENYLELLRRVKEVFDHGDAEERVSALLMFGCWANIAKDCADIRYIVLSSLVSSDVLEVRASLFAAGCLCELSDDFGNVFLEMLTTMLISPKILRDVKLAGARKFGNMWCSFSLADKAYKTGLKFLMDSSEDDFSSIMLISLSRIAFRWNVLIPSQVELLMMFLSEDRSLHLRATSLRCHLFILARGVWNFPSSADMVQKLFEILNKSEFPVIQQLDASKVLHKVFLQYSSTIPCKEIPEIFLKLLVVVENMVKSSVASIRVLAVRILSDLAEKVLGRADIVSGRSGTSLACKNTSSFPSEINFAERKGIGWKVKHNYMDILLGTHNMLLSSEEVLATSDMGHLFSFQIWFLTIRAKFLRTAVDMMKLLDTISCIRDDPPPSEQLERCILFPCDSTSRTLGSSIYTLTEVSNRMKKLAQELDLLILSSIGMDRQSVMIIAALALSCSLLAFIAGFAFLIPKLHSSKKIQIYEHENSEDQFHALLVQDLAGRLKQKDAHARRDLLYLLKSFRNYKGHFYLRFQTQISVAGYESRVLHKLCEDSVTGIVSLQKEASQVQQDGDGVVQIIKDGCQLLLNVISKLFSISFRTPNHFFQVRPAASFELFVVDADGKSLDNISVFSGFHLSLSLCFQLKNLPSGLRGPLTKVCCVLNCKPHCQITEIGDCKGKAHFSEQDQEIDDMMGLNEKLYRYVIGPVESSRDQGDDRCIVTECVTFELNEQGQGFASCLLDVSAFPVGSHRIKWLSGFIDGGDSYRCLLPLKAGMLFTVQDVTRA